MGAVETWQTLRTDAVDSHERREKIIDYPLNFSLDGVSWVSGIPRHLDSSQIRRGKASLIGDWRRLSWLSAINEVQQRYVYTPNVSCRASNGDVVSFTIPDLYRMLHEEPKDPDAKSVRDAKLGVVSGSISAWKRQEASHGRAQPEVSGSHQDGKQRTHALDCFKLWSDIVSATSSGTWDALTYDESSAGMDALVAPGTEAEIKQPEAREPLRISSVPRDEVQSHDDGWYSWRSYRKLGISFDDAYVLLNAAWQEEQVMNARARELAEQRKRALQRLEASDDRHSRGTPSLLKHARYSSQFKGRLCLDGRSVTFIEDGTWHRVTLQLPGKVELHGPAFQTWLDSTMYNAVRSEHIKANNKASKAARLRETRVPDSAGDMGLKKIRGDRWMNTWEGFEVEVTPRKLRPMLPEGAPTWK